MGSQFHVTQYTLLVWSWDSRDRWCLIGTVRNARSQWHTQQTNLTMLLLAATGGEYGASFKHVGPGKVLSVFKPAGGGEPVTIDERQLTDKSSSVVVYDNPHDNLDDLGHIFFQRCLKENVTPYVVTKKTVFKWQEPFWIALKKVFDDNYLQRFRELGLLDATDGELRHMISGDNFDDLSSR
jgi:hypothetical protein